MALSNKKTLLTNAFKDSYQLKFDIYFSHESLMTADIKHLDMTLNRSTTKHHYFL